MTPHIDDHIPALRRYAYRLTKNTDTAEDLVQDTLTRMLSKGPISSIDNIESYMRSVMHNLFVDGTRKHKSDAVRCSGPTCLQRAKLCADRGCAGYPPRHGDVADQSGKGCFMRLT